MSFYSPTKHSPLHSCSGHDAQAAATIAGHRLHHVLGGFNGSFMLDHAMSAYFTRVNEIVVVATYRNGADPSEAQRVAEGVRAAAVDACGGRAADVFIRVLSVRGAELQLAMRRAALGFGRVPGIAGSRFDFTSISLLPELASDAKGAVELRAANDVTALTGASTLLEAAAVAARRAGVLTDALRTVRLPPGMPYVADAAAAEAAALTAATPSRVAAAGTPSRRGRKSTAVAELGPAGNSHWGAAPACAVASRAQFELLPRDVLTDLRGGNGKSNNGSAPLIPVAIELSAIAAAAASASSTSARRRGSNGVHTRHAAATAAAAAAAAAIGRAAPTTRASAAADDDFVLVPGAAAASVGEVDDNEFYDDDEEEFYEGEGGDDEDYFEGEEEAGEGVSRGSSLERNSSESAAAAAATTETVHPAAALEPAPLPRGSVAAAVAAGTTSAVSSSSAAPTSTSTLSPSLPTAAALIAASISASVSPAKPAFEPLRLKLACLVSETVSVTAGQASGSPSNTVVTGTIVIKAAPASGAWPVHTEQYSGAGSGGSMLRFSLALRTGAPLSSLAVSSSAQGSALDVSAPVPLPLTPLSSSGSSSVFSVPLSLSPAAVWSKGVAQSATTAPSPVVEVATLHYTIDAAHQPLIMRVQASSRNVFLPPLIDAAVGVAAAGSGDLDAEIAALSPSLTTHRAVDVLLRSALHPSLTLPVSSLQFLVQLQPAPLQPSAVPLELRPPSAAATAAAADSATPPTYGGVQFKPTGQWSAARSQILWAVTEDAPSPTAAAASATGPTSTSSTPSDLPHVSSYARPGVPAEFKARVVVLNGAQCTLVAPNSPASAAAAQVMTLTPLPVQVRVTWASGTVVPVALAPLPAPVVGGGATPVPVAVVVESVSGKSQSRMQAVFKV